MYFFIIPRTPLKKRTSLRQDLWQSTLQSLINQKSKNWKAIIIGDTRSDNLELDNFISLDYDNFTKKEKIKIALDYIKVNPYLNPTYLIRLDDDDIISRTILSDIDSIKVKYDCYCDRYHTYIDLMYMKISHLKNSWMPNTVIHKYEHAIKPCGSMNIPLILQDHNEYWHEYYSNRNVYWSKMEYPIYFRILTPSSITSGLSNVDDINGYNNYLKYLNGYGPWISLNSELSFFNSLLQLSNRYFSSKPKLNWIHWVFNKVKYLINIFKLR